MLYLHILYLYEYYEVMNVFLIKKKNQFSGATLDKVR